MSYKRRRYRKPYHKKRRSWYAARNMAGYAAAAVTALKIAKEVKGMVNVEYKFFDDDLGNVGSPSTTGSIDCINKVISGGDVSTARDGQQIKMKSLQIKGMMKQHSDQTAVGSFVRIIIIRCCHQDDTDATVATGDTGYLKTASYLSLRNLAGSARTRYVALYDKTFRLSPYGHEGDTKTFKYFKKMNTKVIYNSSATESPRKNSFYVLTISDQVTNTPTVSGYVRFRFLDN